MKYTKLYTTFQFALNEEGKTPTINKGDTARLNAFFHYEERGGDWEVLVFGPYLEGVVKEKEDLDPNFVRYTLEINEPALPGVKEGTHEFLFDHTVVSEGSCTPQPTLLEDGEVPEQVLEQFGLLKGLKSGEIIVP